MFAEAVKDRLLTESPFAELKGGKESNPDRMAYIDAKTAQRVLDACPGAQWRAIFVLCRWAGLRCPSEVLAIRWTDVDWDTGRMRIDSPKTGLRFCPLFPIVRDVLSEAWEAAPEGATHVIERYQGSAGNLRTQFGRILERAMVKPWPKLFQNLRSSCRTDLQEQFPSHAVDAWLGHSTAVAREHYLQVTDEHWERAIKPGPLVGPLAGPLVRDLSGPISERHESRKPNKNKAGDGPSLLQKVALVPPQGLEPRTR
ncbi:MAG: hypothetical protein KatS3mg111_0303 [Pirellulaceae bacterium]|nr:MAG: hypothetical protein KatS3mg111_0303 [Pirellulaceae bacterium]